MEKEYRSLIRLRMSAKDAHYGGNLVDGAHMVHLFGDVATELLIMTDGDEGLFCAYDNIEFLAPVYAGDYIEAEGWVTKIGNTSRKMEFVARKVIMDCGVGPDGDGCDISACLCVRIIGVCRTCL
ncbi:MAG: 3-aminobutyryl-CoA ammonia lyase [Bacteroidales bacterium]|nr:3-aminobutyryl-CoA ammonia lyase [Bacteroidales bacterium]